MNLSPALILIVVAAYFLVLMLVSWLTSKKADNSDFFIAGRQSSWVLVAIGMIGASLSGVTFISVPGAVGGGGINQAFAYLQMVLGYLLGYAVIALVLLPLYYRLHLTSIYTYLGKRFGHYSYKTGAAYFLLSRVIGASLRLFLVSIVIQKFVMESLGVPYWITVATTILLIWVYTFRGGIKTIVWTDTLQTICMLVAVITSIFAIANALETDILGLVDMVQHSEYAQVFFFEGGWGDANNFFKQFISGALITIVMTGLDQDMMQKNLTCRSLKDAQKNMFTFSIILVFANLLFLFLGAVLYIYANNVGLEIPARADQLYPTIALQNLSPGIGIIFILGLIAAAYSSADSALTSLTTSFCIDFLDFEQSEKTEAEKRRLRWMVHIGFSIVLLLAILVVNEINSDSIINELFFFSGLTYGPLLGLFAFGMLSTRKIQDKWVIPICILAPLITYIINSFSADILGGFQFGHLIILLNGFLTFIGLVLISYEDYGEETEKAIN